MLLLHTTRWNEENATCWYNTPSDAIRLRWVIGTLSFWVLFIACGETLMFFIVISYMLRCDVRLCPSLASFHIADILVEKNEKHPATNPVQHGICGGFGR
jgi:hypothetical protein